MFSGTKLYYEYLYVKYDNNTKEKEKRNLSIKSLDFLNHLFCRHLIPNNTETTHPLSSFDSNITETTQIMCHSYNEYETNSNIHEKNKHHSPSKLLKIYEYLHNNKYN